jgi:repressor LexA
VLYAIEAYLWHYERPPTVRDLCNATGIHSVSYVYYLLAELELAGYITRQPDVSRGIRLTRSAGVPSAGMGTTATGAPHLLVPTPAARWDDRQAA